MCLELLLAQGCIPRRQCSLPLGVMSLLLCLLR